MSNKNRAKLLGNVKEGLAFVISAPAGTGKTTLVQKLVNEFPCLMSSVSYTTRQPRSGEVPGHDYVFLSREEFEKKIAAREFLEYVQLYGAYYGTSQQWVRDQRKQGKHVLLTIDTQGALQLKEHYSAVLIFIMPPSLEELKNRLVRRKTETEEVIEKRLAVAQKEIETAQHYDYIIVNDDLDVAYQVLRSIIIAEEHRLRLTNKEIL